MDRPDYAGRLQILGVHARGKTLAKDVDLDKVALALPATPVLISPTFE